MPCTTKKYQQFGINKKYQAPPAPGHQEQVTIAKALSRKLPTDVSSVVVESTHDTTQYYFVTK